MRVRLEDVARAASVSPKTVSRVLNDEANVSDATRLRVRAAMEAMDYRPLPSARSLAGNRSFLVAMLYDNNDNPASTYLAEIQDGVLEACDSHRYSMMMRPLRMRGDDFVRRLDALIENTVGIHDGHRAHGARPETPGLDDFHFVRQAVFLQCRLYGGAHLERARGHASGPGTHQDVRSYFRHYVLYSFLQVLR